MSGGLQPPELWPGQDGQPLSCRDKLKVLGENHEELVQVLRDAFEDAVLIGVDETAMRRLLPVPSVRTAGRSSVHTT